MKRRIVSLFSLVFLSFAVFFFAACNRNDDVDDVVIRIDGSVAEGTTLLDVMEQMQADGELTFVIADGMIASINGVENTAIYNPCWMLYTSDENNSDTEWGSYEYEGEILGSASYGAGQLVVAEGEIYVWSYESF